MTAAITAFTDTDKVRAALGVDSVDVSDEVLLDMQLGLELTLDLESWATGYGSFTGNSLSMLYLYAAAFCALSAIDGRELLYPLLFKDGKAETRRFELDLQKIKDSLRSRVSKWRAALEAEEGLAVTEPAAATYIFGSATPDFDPVTGE